MKDKVEIAVIDDELIVCQSCEKIIRRQGYSVDCALSGKEALELLEKKSAEGGYDVIFTDLKMPDIGGLEILRLAKLHSPTTPVVIITGYATVASAIEAMKSGAFDYLPKPFTPQELLGTLENALRKRRMLLRNVALYTGQEKITEFMGLVGQSPKMQELYAMIRKVAETDTTVLICGESGTGKELVARAIHNLSARRTNPFIAVDCGTLSSELLESELFGHIKGSFTGAVSTKKGLFEIAEKGTIFLDEIANTSPGVQAKLLRVLEEREFLPLGATQYKKADVRVLCATNEDLRELVRNGSFRQDLYYRLSVFPLYIPPLRERKEDIPLLAYHFLKQHSRIGQRSDKPVPTQLAEKTLEMLMEYDWPGNVRELSHIIERMVIVCDGDTLLPAHLPPQIYSESIEENISIPRTAKDLKILKKELREKAVADVERRFVLQALERNNWNVTRAAEDVGMQRPNFQALLRKYNIRLRDLSPSLKEEHKEE
ncbi:sigma-54-dependent Fis family transcriptional regulator [Candidatus Sumerlaeota bacterium]|nr:sigma-54-dependent Fis family transcriptional regulator [Candidatus Sumerlaeota bacterium]